MKWFDPAHRKRFLWGILALGIALFPLPAQSQIFEMREIFPGNSTRVFTEDAFACEKPEHDLEMYWANDEARTAAVVIYKRERHGIALVEYLRRHPHGWQILLGFFTYKPELHDYIITHSNEELLGEFFPDDIMDPMTEKLRTKQCE